MKLEIIRRYDGRLPQNGFISTIKSFSSHRNKMFRFSKPAVQSLNIKKGTKIHVLREPKTQNYYLYPSEEGEFEIRNRKETEYTFSSARLRKIMLEDFGENPKGSIHFEILNAVKDKELGVIFPLRKLDITTLIKHTSQ